MTTELKPKIFSDAINQPPKILEQKIFNCILNKVGTRIDNKAVFKFYKEFLSIPKHTVSKILCDELCAPTKVFYHTIIGMCNKHGFPCFRNNWTLANLILFHSLCEKNVFVFYFYLEIDQIPK